MEANFSEIFTRNRGKPPKRGENATPVESITHAMLADIDLLFAGERAIKLGRVTNTDVERLANLTMAEWLKTRGIDCTPYIDALSFEALGTGGGLAALQRSLRRVFRGTEDEDTDSAESIANLLIDRLVDQPQAHPLFLKLRTYVIANQFGRKSFEKLVNRILATISDKQQIKSLDSAIL